MTIIVCIHQEDGRPCPCPPGCPYQQWPPAMFRRSWFRGRWILRRKYRLGEAYVLDDPAATRWHID